MNIFSEIFPTDGSNSSDYFFFTDTEVKNMFSMSSLVDIIIVLLGFPINSYVIWLIVRGAGNGLAAEFFILNLSVCEVLLCTESLLNLLIYKVENLWLTKLILNSLGITGRALFQCLICVERYLAVVRPVTFLKYKPLRYRVMCCVIAWVATFVFSGICSMIIYLFQSDFYFIFIMAQFSLYLSIQLFCLGAVLRALKQSGPGERGREKNMENHMKRRALYIILITTVTLLIIYFPFMILLTFSNSISNVEITICIGLAVFIFAGWVQPLLFLYRVGKLPFIKSQ